MTDAPVLAVLEPGLLTTVQDLGRPDAAPLGVPRAGACDQLALAAANLLVGNQPGAAALEISLLGPVLEVLRGCLVGLTGADFESVSLDRSTDEPPLRLSPGRSYALSRNATLRFGVARDGARGYLAIEGGIAVPDVLGSAATLLSAGLGGTAGRPLREGDHLDAHQPPLADGRLSPRVWPGPGPSSGVPISGPEVALRVVRGPHADLLGDAAWRQLLSTAWHVDPRSNRMGVRLTPSDRDTSNAHESMDRATAATPPAPELVSLPMTWGAVQLPPGGCPICLLVDHPTVGGYPVIAVVAAVDLPTLGQLRPSHRVHFQPMELTDAQAELIRQGAAMGEAARRLGLAEPGNRVAGRTGRTTSV